MKINIQNPISNGWYADPEARYYNGKYYIYVTHSLPYEEQTNQSCFVSSDLTNWELKENIIDMSGFKYAEKAIWAPTVVEKEGKYYYIFASNDIHPENPVGGLEIAVSNSPTGPFKALLGKPLINEFHFGAQPIDAHFFKDDNGEIYLLYGGWGHCVICKMADDMKGFTPFDDGEIFKEITPNDYVEGPCMFKRENKYYFFWSAGNWQNGTYRVNYATANSPLGPFENGTNILDSGDGKLANGPGITV